MRGARRVKGARCRWDKEIVALGQLELRRRRRVARRGRPVIDRGSRGAVGVATQVAGASCVDVRKQTLTHENVKLTHGSAERALGMRTVKHE